MIFPIVLNFQNWNKEEGGNVLRTNYGSFRISTFFSAKSCQSKIWVFIFLNCFSVIFGILDGVFILSFYNKTIFIPQVICKNPTSFYSILQLDYYTMDSPSHWSTVSEVTEEIYTIKNLAASSTVIFVVRARNHHGLSPPSPMSKPMKTSGSGSLSNLGLLPSSTEPDLATVRLRLSQRIVELKEALVAGSRKVKLLWEVNQFFLFLSDISYR